MALSRTVALSFSSLARRSLARRRASLSAALAVLASAACNKPEPTNAAAAAPDDSGAATAGASGHAGENAASGSAGSAGSAGSTGSTGSTGWTGSAGTGGDAPPDPEPTPEPTPELDTEELFVDHDGLRHYVRVHGSGPNVLVVLNGGPGQSHHYCQSSDALASGELRVVTYDQCGSGATGHPADRDYSHDAYADDLDAIRRQLGVERIHLLGHSNGGLLALAYTARHGSHVASLQLDGSSPATGAEADSKEFDARIATYEAKGAFPPGYDQFGSTTDCAPYFKTIWPVYLHDATWPVPALVEQTACDLRAFSGSSRSNGTNWDLSSGLRSFGGPVTIYYGESDPFRSESESIASHFTGTTPTVTPLPACGHYWEECADAFFPQASAFVARHL